MKSGPALIEYINQYQVPEGQCAFWWLGQQSFVVKLGATVCYLDPYLHPDKERQVPPLLKPEEVTNADVVLGTHDHGDHIDRKSWPGIAKASPQAKFVVPKLLRKQVVSELELPDKRVLGVDEGITAQVGEVSITAVPAAHEFLDLDPATKLHPYLGYILEAHGFRLYHAGDTCLYEGMQAKLRQWPLDLAFLPINGRDARRLGHGCIGNLTYQEAVDLAGAIRPGLTIPAHFEMFAMNGENPQLFVDYMEVKYPHLESQIPVHGEGVLVAKEQPVQPKQEETEEKE